MKKNQKFIFTLLILSLFSVTFFNSCGSDSDVETSGTCSDGIMNQDETGVDCGGSSCNDCPTCDDGEQNGDETGVDCGGICNACPTCNDGIQNGDEVGVDCGGSDCDECTMPFSEHLTCIIEGVPFEANIVSGFEDNVTLEFQSDQSQDRQLFFTLPSGIEPGTYELVDNEGFEVELRELQRGEFVTMSGSIIIISNDTEARELSGTFEFVTEEKDFGETIATVNVSEGSFSVRYNR